MGSGAGAERRHLGDLRAVTVSAVDLNAAADIAIIVGGIGVILSGVGWLLKKFRDSILDEVKPNGGDTDSLGDRVVRIENNQVAAADRIALIEGHLSEHVQADLEVQRAAAQALVEGQNHLLARLEALEIKKPPTPRRRTTK